MHAWLSGGSESRSKKDQALPPLVAAAIILWAILSHPAQSLERVENRLLHNGTEIWLGGIDFQSVAVRPGIDEIAVLDRLKQSGLNKIRIWAYPWFLKENGLIPWIRNAQGKANLNRWDQDYWDTVKAFVSAAEQREIFVEYTLFASKPSQSKWWTTFNVVWNPDFNTNGVLARNINQHAYPELYQLDSPFRSHSGKRIVDYQQALIDKAIDELGGFDNLFFEVANEFPTDFQNRGYLDQSVAWALHWADYIAARTDRLVAVHAHDSSGPHLRGLNHYINHPAIDILNFHFYTTPNTLANLFTQIDKPPHQVLQSNESHAFFVSEAKLNEATQEAWAAYLSGLHYSFFFRDKDVEKMFKPAWEPAIARLASIKNTAQLFPVSGLSTEYADQPVKNLISHGPAPDTQWLAAAYKQSAYIFYFWAKPAEGYVERLTGWLDALITDHTQISADLKCAPYSYRWVDARNSKVLDKGTINSCPISVPAPPVKQWDPNAGLALIIGGSR